MDVNHDGHPDIVAGNLGLNNPWHISQTQPAEMIAKDFDGNGILDPVFCYYIRGDDGQYRLSAGVSRDNWAVQMPSIKKKFDNNAKYAAAPMEDIFTRDMMAGAMVLDCKEVRSGWFENDGKGNFRFHPFPAMAQIAPVNAMASEDVNGDGFPDLILAGNDYEASLMSGRYDASYGLLLEGDGRGGWRAMPPASDGLILDGDVRDIKMIRVGGGRYLLAGVNDQPMRAFRLSKP